MMMVMKCPRCAFRVPAMLMVALFVFSATIGNNKLVYCPQRNVYVKQASIKGGCMVSFFLPLPATMLMNKLERGPDGKWRKRAALLGEF
jgi:hypothetical protein